MTPRFPKLSTRTYALLAGGLLLGATLAPVAAQTSGLDGQLAVRSDGAVYLISGGQRRWVATVAITDDEINAYPEGEPIYTALAPIGSGQTAAAPAPKPVAGASPGPATTAAAPATAPASGTTAAAPGATEVGTPTGATGQINPALPIEVDIDGETKIEAGERLVVNVRTKTGASCDLTVRWPDGTEAPQGKMTADSEGACRYSIVTPAGAAAGTGTLRGVVQDGGVTSNQQVEFEIIPLS